MLFYQPIKALCICILSFFLDFVFWNIASGELMFFSPFLFCLFPLWFDDVNWSTPRVLLFVHSRAVPIEVTEWRLGYVNPASAPSLTSLDSVYSRWIDIRLKSLLPPRRFSAWRRWKLNPHHRPPELPQNKTHIQRMSIAVKIVKCEATTLRTL